LDGRVLKKKVKIGDEFLLGEVEEQFHFFEVREESTQGRSWMGQRVGVYNNRHQLSSADVTFFGSAEGRKGHVLLLYIIFFFFFFFGPSYYL
jgi:hypothetical protein